MEISPPDNIPSLEEESDEAQVSESLDIRARLAEHRVRPECAACHSVLDPIGFGLEQFDAIGRHRTHYAEALEVDASGVLPDGRSFNGLMELTSLLEHDARLESCVVRNLFTYALSRQLYQSDDPFIVDVQAQWQNTDHSVAALLELIVLSKPFRWRRGADREVNQ